jgi:hypothetical protein
MECDTEPPEAEGASFLVTIAVLWAVDVTKNTSGGAARRFAPHGLR